MPGQHASRTQRRRRRIALSASLSLIVGIGLVALVFGAGSSGRLVTRAATSRKEGVAGQFSRHGADGVATTVPTTAAPVPTTTAPTTLTTNPDEVTGVFATAAIDSYLQAQDSDINAAVYDLSTGQLSLYRPGALEYTASIVKVDILATLLHQAEEQGVALSATEQDLATTMIENSDDDAATDLWDDIGEQTGLAGFNSLIPMPNTIPGTDGYWGATTTTGEDQVSLLRQLVQPSELLDQSEQSDELGLMEDVEADQAWGVSAGVPAGVTVALKNGWLPLEGDTDWQVNSIGWVDGAGRDYLIAVLTKNNDTEGDGITTIEGLSSLVWDALG